MPCTLFSLLMLILFASISYYARSCGFEVYKKYPLLREAINRRSIVYNQQLEQVERMEAAGEIVVIRPQKPVVVDRIERDIKKLTELYEEGYRCAEHFAFRF